MFISFLFSLITRSARALFLITRMNTSYTRLVSASGCFVFSTISTCNRCKVNIYVLFYKVSAKNIFSPFIFTWFLILDKTQASGQDGNLVLGCHRNPAVPSPTKYTSSCREDQRLSTEGKILLKHCNISKTIKEGGPSNHPPCTAVEVCVYVRGLCSGPMDVVKLTIFFVPQLQRPLIANLHVLLKVSGPKRHQESIPFWEWGGFYH